VNGWLTVGLGGLTPPQLSAGTVGSKSDTVVFRHKNMDEFQALHDWLVTPTSRRLTGPCDQHPRIRSHVTTLGSGNQDNSVGLDFPESTIIKDDRVSRVTAPY